MLVVEAVELVEEEDLPWGRQAKHLEGRQQAKHLQPGQAGQQRPCCVYNLLLVAEAASW